jgi:hypothetical protein
MAATSSIILMRLALTSLIIKILLSRKSLYRNSNGMDRAY